MDPNRLLVSELRLELEQRNLDSKGRKAVLVSRLQRVLNDERQINEREQRENEVHINDLDMSDVIIPLNSETMNLDSEIGVHAVDMNMSVDNNNTMNLNGENGDDIGDVNMNVDGNDAIGAANGAPANMNSINSINSAEIAAVTIDVNAVQNKVNYVLMTGQRFKSNVLYSKDQQQFYHKNKPLVNGLISYDCAQKHKNKCNRHVYLDPKKEECFYQIPYAPHNHSTQEQLYDNLAVCNTIRDNCAKPDVLANLNAKTSVSKAIFMKEIQE